MYTETTHSLSVCIHVYPHITKPLTARSFFLCSFPFSHPLPRPPIQPSPETSIYVCVHLCKLFTHMYTCVVVWCDCAKQTGFFCQKTPSSLGLFHKRDLIMMKVDSSQAPLVPFPFLSRTHLHMYVRTHLLQIAKCRGVFEVRLVGV